MSRLELLAIEVSTLTPTSLKPNRSACIPTSLVEDIRHELAAIGVDWKSIHRANRAALKARAAARKAGT